MNNIKHLSLYNDVGQSVNMNIKNEHNLYPHYHNHGFWEFMLIESGSFIQIINDKELVLNKNELYILNPLTVHKIKPASKKSALFVNFEISNAFMQSFFDTLGLSLEQTFSFEVLQLHCSDIEMYSFVSLLDTLPQKDIFTNDSTQNVLKLIASKIILKALEYLSTAPKYAHKNNIITSMLIELNDKNNFSLSLNEICSKLNYCHEYITRLFKQNNLDSPVNIFLKNKLTHSCTYLLSSTFNITTIAQLCGINSTSYYNKCFKKEYGITPSEYRKKFAMPCPPTKN